MTNINKFNNKLKNINKVDTQYIYDIMGIIYKVYSHISINSDSE